MTNTPNIPTTPRILGLAGLLPQAAFLAAIIFDNGEWKFSALALAYGYAALIFSFLGGMWWGLAAASYVGRESDSGQGAKPGAAPAWVYGVAVMPSLIALISYVPWILGWDWPVPSLLLLGVCIAASPLVDRRLVAVSPAIMAPLAPEWWMPLRWTLSLGLGGLTLAIALVA